MFENEGEYRQNLTQAKDCILQAALSLLNAQQEMGKMLSEKSIQAFPQKAELPYETKSTSSQPPKGISSTSISGTNSLIGAGGGALVGKVLLGGWGAVFGAIAGTAVMLYLSYRENAKAQQIESSLRTSPPPLKNKVQTPLSM